MTRHDSTLAESDGVRRGEGMNRQLESGAQNLAIRLLRFRMLDKPVWWSADKATGHPCSPTPEPRVHIFMSTSEYRSRSFFQALLCFASTLTSEFANVLCLLLSSPRRNKRQATGHPVFKGISFCKFFFK